jgi:hypothetical protein
MIPVKIRIRQGTARRLLATVSSVFLERAGLNFAIREFCNDATIAVVRGNTNAMRTSRRTLCTVPLAFAALLLGCGPKPAPSLPPRVGEWTLSSSEPSTTIPPVLAQLGHRATKVYEYQGPVAVRVTAHEMSSETVAFEALQKWVAEPGTLPLQRRQFLLIPASPDKAALTRFTQALAASF